VLTPLAILLALAGAGWGYGADRIGARWPAHDDGHVRRVDWRTPVAVAFGALALGAVTLRFETTGPALLFGAYLTALVLLPALPIALVLDLLALNPFVGVPDLPVTLLVALGVPALLALIAIPFGAGAIGMGDLKLLVSVGLLAGPFRLVAGVVDGALLAGIVVIVLLVARRITLRSYIPFGPFLIFGAAWAILVVR
jgi:leader peptidase (prepilin peptidase)/N-methyltransferase